MMYRLKLYAIMAVGVVASIIGAVFYIKKQGALDERARQDLRDAATVRKMRGISSSNRNRTDDALLDELRKQRSEYERIL